MNDQEFVAELDAILAGLGEKNHYEVLGITRDATAQDVRQAFHGLAKSFHVDAHPELKGDPEVRRKLQKVFGAINEAQRVLGNAQSRSEYDANLDVDESNAAGAEIERILRAEENFRIAMRLLERDDLTSVRERLGEALELNPEEPQFQAWMAWIRYGLLEKLPKGSSKAEEERRRIGAQLRQIIQRNEKCADAHLLLAHVYRNEGNIDEAEKSYRTVLELKPKHAVASSNLRLIRSRKAQKSKGFLARLFSR